MKMKEKAKTGIRAYVNQVRARLFRPVRREAGIALLIVTVTLAVIGATVGEFAYNSQVDLEAAANSRDMLRAEYLARSSIQLGQLLVAVQNSLNKQMQSLPPEIRNLLVITDYAGFLAKAFGSDKEAREGLGGLIGLDLSGAKGLGTPPGTSFDLNIASEEGKYFLNCGGAVNLNPDARTNLYTLVNALVRPLRYDRMFNVPDPDGVVVTREDLPRAIIDWGDVDLQRYEPQGGSTGAEERYDRGRDRYEAHNHNLDTTEELTLVRGVSEDFFAAFGDLFTVYGQDCRVLASAVSADSWPLVAGMIAASAADPNVVYDPNTVVVAQQVAGILKTGLPLLTQLAKTVKIEKCVVDKSQCQAPGSSALAPPPPPPPPVPGAKKSPPAPSGDSVDLLSNLICSPYISQLPSLSQGLSATTGADAPPPPTTGLRPIKMCPGKLGKFLRDNPQTGNPRRYYRIDATGLVQRNEKKSTQVRIRGVWDSQHNNSFPLCTNHPSCTRGGTWVYYRMD